MSRFQFIGAVLISIVICAFPVSKTHAQTSNPVLVTTTDPTTPPGVPIVEVNATTGYFWISSDGVSLVKKCLVPILRGVTGNIGGSLLLAGSCSSGTASVSGALIGDTVNVSTTDGTNIAALGLNQYGTVTSNGTVTVNICALLSVTPPSKTYNVAVFSQNP